MIRKAYSGHHFPEEECEVILGCIRRTICQRLCCVPCDLSALQIDLWTITIFRGLVGTVFSSTAVAMNSKRVLFGKRENMKLLCLRGVFDGINVATAFYAVNQMNLAQAAVIIFTCE